MYTNSSESGSPPTNVSHGYLLRHAMSAVTNLIGGSSHFFPANTPDKQNGMQSATCATLQSPVLSLLQTPTDSHCRAPQAPHANTHERVTVAVNLPHGDLLAAVSSIAHAA